MDGYVLVKSGLDAGNEHIQDFFSLGAGRLACDVQQVDDGIFKVIGFDGLLLPFCSSAWAASRSSGACITSLPYSWVTLLLGGHHCHHTTNVMRINA